MLLCYTKLDGTFHHHHHHRTQYPTERQGLDGPFGGNKCEVFFLK